jgi:hypothetical protein
MWGVWTPYRPHSGPWCVSPFALRPSALAVGVAAGQIAGGLLVSAHLLDEARRPALLLNVPFGLDDVLADRLARAGKPAGRDAGQLAVDGVFDATAR